jgi:DNA invertase Pin-like site-specific DNA recombinase
LIEEYTEVESGKKNNRLKLSKAIIACKQNKATLFIAKLDRLSLNVAFVMTLRDSGVEFIACDLPDSDTLTIGMMVNFAQYKAERTSERTRAALSQKKAQGFRLGKPENSSIKAIRKSQIARTNNARNNIANVQATELAILYRNKGMTYLQIAVKLNQHYYKTRRQKKFDGKAIYRLLIREKTENSYLHTSSN